MTVDRIARMPLLRNAAALVSGSASAAILGFAYWWLAARLFAPDGVGTAAAAISMMGLMGLLGEGGLGTLLVGAATGHEGRGPGLISAALLAGLAISGIAGIVYLLAIGLPGLPSSPASLVFAALFAAGSALTGAALVLDQGFVGLMQSHFQMVRNAIFSIAKLGLLFVLAGTAIPVSELVLASWVAALALSIAAAAFLATRAGTLAVRPPDFRLLRSLSPKVVDHHLLNVATQAPVLAIPPIVSVVLTPTVNAAFYPMWMVLGIAGLIPGALTTVLFTAGVSERRTWPRQLALSLAVSLSFAAVTAVLFLVGSDALLSFFNPVYPEVAGGGQRWLGLGLVGLTFKYHFVALLRNDDAMRRGFGPVGLGGLLELALAALGGQVAGLQGLAIGYVVAVSLQVPFFAAPLWRAMARSSVRE